MNSISVDVHDDEDQESFLEQVAILNRKDSPIIKTRRLSRPGTQYSSIALPEVETGQDAANAKPDRTACQLLSMSYLNIVRSLLLLPMVTVALPCFVIGLLGLAGLLIIAVACALTCAVAFAGILTSGLLGFALLVGTVLVTAVVLYGLGFVLTSACYPCLPADVQEELKTKYSWSSMVESCRQKCAVQAEKKRENARAQNKKNKNNQEIRTTKKSTVNDTSV